MEYLPPSPCFIISWFLRVCASQASHPLYFTDVTSSKDLTDFKFLKSKELPRCEIPFINLSAEGKVGAWLCEPPGIHVEDEQ